MATLFADITLKRKDGEVVSADALQFYHLKGKTVALYFSAHWCPPCRKFTPLLKQFYEEAVDSGLEIVFISSDHSADEQEAYITESHGNWLYIPHGDPGIGKLEEKYGVDSIPVLILINNDGSVAIEDARDDVEEHEVKAALQKWADKVV